ncbi:MAG: hypothetical protein K8S22_17500 [Betaproteobacteria bacterium]|nr:hypothetical protein [Betaproteobacteria bacterium]
MLNLHRTLRAFIVTLIYLLAFGANELYFSGNAFAQPDSSGGMVDLNAGDCKIRVTENVAKSAVERGLRYVWNGACRGGYAHGLGISRLYYSNGRLFSISKMTRENGAVVQGSNETYSFFDGNGVFTYAKPGQERTEIPPTQVAEWAREIVDGKPRPFTQTAQAVTQPGGSTFQNRVENKPGQPIGMGGNPPGQGGSTPGAQTGSGSSSGVTTTGASSGGVTKAKGGARFDGSMTTPTGVYFLTQFYQGSPVSSYVPRFGQSEAAALATYGGIQTWRQKYEGLGCPAGSRVGGPYWAALHFNSGQTPGRRGAVWVCGATSERAAAFAAVDLCKSNSCADPGMYLFINVGSAVTGLYPQFACAEGHYTPGAKPGTGPRNGKGWRGRERPGGGGLEEDFSNPQDTPLCNEIVERWH